MAVNKWVNAQTNDVAKGNEDMLGNSFLDMGVCLSLGFGMRQAGFLQNIADKQGKSAPRVILPKRRHKNCFLALAVLVGQEACWLVRSTRLPALVARRLGLSKSDYQK